MTPETRSTNLSVEAGAGRPFRFSLAFREDGRGSLRTWMGPPWSSLLGVAFVAGSATAAVLVSHLMPAGVRERTDAFAAMGAAIGALAVAVQLRTRSVLFALRDGVWCWRRAWSLPPGAWVAITSDDPMLLEREPLDAESGEVEGFTLSVGSRRLLSYLGDPSVGRGVVRAFRGAGVPVVARVKAVQA